MLRTTHAPRYVFHNNISPALEQVAIARGFQAPLWFDAKKLRSAFIARQRIFARPGERPTALMVQQRTALFNVDQLRPGPRAIDFLSTLPDRKKVQEPTDVVSLQPFRGAIAEQLRFIAAQNKWSNFWISSPDIKFRGFHHISPGGNNGGSNGGSMGFAGTAPAWKQSVQQVEVLNFDQLAPPADSGVDLSATPVNFRYNMLMLGTSLSEQLRTEALRRGIKYPVVATAKIIETVGCTVIPEHVAGFRPVDLASAYGGAQQTKWQRGAMLYNLDEFTIGGAAIEKALSLPPADVPTFAFNQQRIQRQLVICDAADSATSAAHAEEMLAEDVEEEGRRQAAAATEAAPIPVDDKGLPKYRSQYWIRAFEADQLSDGAWKLRPGARSAVLGDFLKQFPRAGSDAADSAPSESMSVAEHDMFGGGGGGAAMSLGDADTDMTAGSGQGAGGGRPFSMLPPIVPLSEAPRVQRWMGADGQPLNPRQARVSTTAYYFSTDVREAGAFLAALGTYIF